MGSKSFVVYQVVNSKTTVYKLLMYLSIYEQNADTHMEILREEEHTKGIFNLKCRKQTDNAKTITH